MCIYLVEWNWEHGGNFLTLLDLPKLSYLSHENDLVPFFQTVEIKFHILFIYYFIPIIFKCL